MPPPLYRNRHPDRSNGYANRNNGRRRGSDNSYAVRNGPQMDLPWYLRNEHEQEHNSEELLVEPFRGTFDPEPESDSFPTGDNGDKSDSNSNSNSNSDILLIVSSMPQLVNHSRESVTSISYSNIDVLKAPNAVVSQCQYSKNSTHTPIPSLCSNMTHNDQHSHSHPHPHPHSQKGASHNRNDIPSKVVYPSFTGSFCHPGETSDESTCIPSASHESFLSSHSPPLPLSMRQIHLRVTMIWWLIPFVVAFVVTTSSTFKRVSHQPPNTNNKTNNTNTTTNTNNNNSKASNKPKRTKRNKKPRNKDRHKHPNDDTILMLQISDTTTPPTSHPQSLQSIDCTASLNHHNDIPATTFTTPTKSKQDPAAPIVTLPTLPVNDTTSILQTPSPSTCPCPSPWTPQLFHSQVQGLAAIVSSTGLDRKSSLELANASLLRRLESDFCRVEEQKQTIRNEKARLYDTRKGHALERCKKAWWHKIHFRNISSCFGVALISKALSQNPVVINVLMSLFVYDQYDNQNSLLVLVAEQVCQCSTKTTPIGVVASNDYGTSTNNNSQSLSTVLSTWMDATRAYVPHSTLQTLYQMSSITCWMSCFIRTFCMFSFFCIVHSFVTRICLPQIFHSVINLGVLIHVIFYQWMLDDDIMETCTNLMVRVTSANFLLHLVSQKVTNYLDSVADDIHLLEKRCSFWEKLGHILPPLLSIVLGIGITTTWALMKDIGYGLSSFVVRWFLNFYTFNE